MCRLATRWIFVLFVTLIGRCNPFCVLDTKKGWKIDCGLRDSYLFRVKDFGGIHANFDVGFGVGDEKGFPNSISKSDHKAHHGKHPPPLQPHQQPYHTDPYSLQHSSQYSGHSPQYAYSPYRRNDFNGGIQNAVRVQDFPYKYEVPSSRSRKPPQKSKKGFFSRLLGWFKPYKQPRSNQRKPMTHPQTHLYNQAQNRQTPHYPLQNSQTQYQQTHNGQTQQLQTQNRQTQHNQVQNSQTQYQQAQTKQLQQPQVQNRRQSYQYNLRQSHLNPQQPHYAPQPISQTYHHQRQVSNKQHQPNQWRAVQPHAQHLQQRNFVFRRNPSNTIIPPPPPNLNHFGEASNHINPQFHSPPSGYSRIDNGLNSNFRVFDTPSTTTSVPTVGPSMGDLLKIPAHTKANTDNVPSFAAKMFIIREAPREFYPPGYRDAEQRTGLHVQVPRTKFYCENQKFLPGIYSDAQLGCKIFHLCVPSSVGSTLTSYLCPNGTLFDQSILQCNYWYNVECEASIKDYDSNLALSTSYRRINAAYLPIHAATDHNVLSLLSPNTPQSTPKKNISSRRMGRVLNFVYNEQKDSEGDSESESESPESINPNQKQQNNKGKSDSAIK